MVVRRANYMRKSASLGAKRPPGRKRSVVIGRVGTVLEYFESKVDRTSDCHIWTGALSYGGYGVFGSAKRDDASRSRMAHRWAYEQWRGTVPPGLHLDHLCNVRACVNPAHLEPVTALVNNRRAIERRELIAA